MKRHVHLFSLAVWLLAASGCAENQTRVAEGAGIGGLIGAAAGGIIGHQGRHGGQGALIGGAVGAATGAIVGAQMKKNRAADTTDQPSSRVTLQQIVDWTKEGVASDEIISRIQTSGSTYSLTADDLSYLRKQGVSERVIETMQANP